MRHDGCVPYAETTRTSDDVVAPTLADPLARAATSRIGGPIGRHAGAGRGWWSPLRIVLLVATVCFGLGIVQKSPCVVTDWSDAASPKAFSHMCYSDIAYLYPARGLAEGILPYTPVDDLPASARPATSADDHQVSIEYPVLTGVWMGLAGAVTHLIGKDPDVSKLPHAEVTSNLDVQHDGTVFWGVNAVGFFVVLLLAMALLVLAQRRRPWDALYVAAAPVLALTAMINWDVLAIGMVAGALWAWSTRRPVVAGIFIGLGTATKLYPLFILGPLLVLCFRERRMAAWTKTAAAALVAWLVVDLPIYIWSPDEFLWFWQFNSSRGADYGSLWLVNAIYRPDHAASAHTINLVTWVFFGACCLLITLLGLLAARRPRLPQLVLLVTVAFLVVNKVYSPQYVLWLLPFAVLARPRWRDLMIWQTCEVLYFFAVWMHIANFFVASGDKDWMYALAILIRIAGELYLVAVVVRDILAPWHDPVRMDGLSDDPLGGVLDEGIDNERDDQQPRHDDEPDVEEHSLAERLSIYEGAAPPGHGRPGTDEPSDPDPDHDHDHDPIYAP
jgi:uncharacterized membrane protein